MTKQVLCDTRIRLARNLLGEGMTKVVRVNVLADPRPFSDSHHRPPERL